MQLQAIDFMTQPTQPRVTILDVARQAGVSKSSVSRFLDERLPKSESKTAQHVRKIAKDMGYVRDSSAANLRRGKTNMIGVIVPRLADTVMAMLYESLQREATKFGKFAIVATTDEAPNADRLAAESLLQRGVDGLILSTVRDGDTLPKELTDRGIPYVLALRTDGTSLSAIGDDVLGGYLATRHLVDLGHTNIGIIAGPSYTSSARKRVDGYRQALTEANIELNDDWIVESTFGINSGGEAAKKLLELTPKISAIFAVNDNTAIGALAVIIRKGLVVPDDISLVGYNDIPIVSHLPVPLTSVHVPLNQIASTALELLATGSVLSGDRIRMSIPTLIPRRSTAPIKRF